ncbi:unnamed protein product [Cochlearia groenlandica]
MVDGRSCGRIGIKIYIYIPLNHLFGFGINANENFKLQRRSRKIRGADGGLELIIFKRAMESLGYYLNKISLAALHNSKTICPQDKFHSIMASLAISSKVNGMKRIKMKFPQEAAAAI